MTRIKKKRGLSKQQAFLAAYIRTANVTKAARAAKIDRGLPYRWLHEDKAYSLLFEEAREQAAQTLEDEAVRRAHEGVMEPVIWQGQFTYKQRPVKDAAGNAVMGFDGKPLLEDYGKPLCVNKKSDGVLMFLLKAFNPARFKDRVATEHSGTIQIVISSDDAQL